MSEHPREPTLADVAATLVEVMARLDRIDARLDLIDGRLYLIEKTMVTQDGIEAFLRAVEATP